MPTIGHVYAPLVEARHDKDKFQRLLVEVGQKIFEANPDKCSSVEDGIEAAKRNLDYYCQYYSEETAAEVKKAMGRPLDWVGLGGQRVVAAFAKTFCSQCGAEFGAGNHGYSHCEDHR